MSPTSLWSLTSSQANAAGTPVSAIPKQLHATMMFSITPNRQLLESNVLIHTVPCWRRHRGAAER